MHHVLPIKTAFPALLHCCMTFIQGGGDRYQEHLFGNLPLTSWIRCVHDHVWIDYE